MRAPLSLAPVVTRGVVAKHSPAVVRRDVCFTDDRTPGMTKTP